MSSGQIESIDWPLIAEIKLVGGGGGRRPTNSSDFRIEKAQIGMPVAFLCRLDGGDDEKVGYVVSSQKCSCRPFAIEKARPQCS